MAMGDNVSGAGNTTSIEHLAASKNPDITMSNDLMSAESLIADPDRVYELVANAAALGPRLPGSAALRRFEEILATGFAASGLTVELLPYTVRSWVAREWSLSLGNGRPDAVVSGYYPESGVTALEGTTAP